MNHEQKFKACLAVLERLEAEARRELGGRMAALGVWTTDRARLVDAIRRLTFTATLSGRELEDSFESWLRPFLRTMPSTPAEPKFSPRPARRDDESEHVADPNGLRSVGSGSAEFTAAHDLRYVDPASELR